MKNRILLLLQALEEICPPPAGQRHCLRLEVDWTHHETGQIIDTAYAIQDKNPPLLIADIARNQYRMCVRLKDEDFDRPIEETCLQFKNAIEEFDRRVSAGSLVL